MKPLFLVFSLIAATSLFSQSYVDAGIRHYAVGEYDEALIDFKDAEEIESMITESSKAKMYYYRGMIYLSMAEKSAGDFAEEDPIQLCYQDLFKVMRMDNSWEPQIKEAYNKLYSLLITEADEYLKFEKKEDEKQDKVRLLTNRISYLIMANSLDVSSLVNLYLGQTNMQAGNLFFQDSNEIGELRKAKEYYIESLKYYEQARYDDPFSKEIIQDLLTISKRINDSDRVEEYEKLLRLAGG